VSQMWVEIYREAGYEQAMRAVRLSRRSTLLMDTVGDDLGDADLDLCLKLLNADRHTEGQPHSVGLRQIVFWIGVEAPLYWWKHTDRYSIGKDQASDSTMYNLMNIPLTQDDFAWGVDQPVIDVVNSHIERGEFEYANANLPHSFLQERSLMVSLPTLRRIISQRKGHKLGEWRFFCQEILDQAKYPELLD
jgi:hypothetical protein